jgi:iron complex outermembrane recepter protein
MASKSHLMRTAGVLAVCVIASAAGAQTITDHTSATSTPAPAADEQRLDEVVVTAQKRSENLQKVPITIDVISEAQIQSRDVGSLVALSEYLPAMFVIHGSAQDRLFIRGIGSGDNGSFDQSVDTFIDGVYNGRSRTSEAGFLDVQRVEVLKGPQTLYFGNSAIGGAIDVISHQPGASLSGYTLASTNLNFGGYHLEGAVTLPINSTLSARIAAVSDDTAGYIDDLTAHVRVPEARTNAGRIILDWNPAEQLEFKLKAEYGDDHQIGGVLSQMVYCPPPAIFGAPRGFCPAAIAAGDNTVLDFKRSTYPGSGTKTSRGNATGTVDYKAGSLDVTSISAFTGYSYAAGWDSGGTSTLLFAGYEPENYKQYSEEIRVASSTDDPVSFLAGLYYQYGRLRTTLNIGDLYLSPKIAPAFPTLAPYLPLGQAEGDNQDETDYSGFATATWKVTSRLRLIGGLRYQMVTKDTLKISRFGTFAAPYGSITPFPSSISPTALAYTNNIAPTGDQPFHRTDTHLSPSAVLQYDLANDVMMYVKFSNGFKAGGFNAFDTTGSNSSVPYNPETVNAYEGGVKAQWFDRRLTFNADIFRSEYSGLQVAGVKAGVLPPQQTVQNAGGAISEGFELSSRVIFNSNWSSSFDATLLHSYYKSYLNANATSYQTLIGQVTQNLSGHSTVYAPKYSGTWNIDYETPLFGKFVSKAELTTLFSDSYNYSSNLDPYMVQKAYARLDLSVSLSDPRRGWTLALFGRNLTNQKIATYGAASPASLGSFQIQLEQPANVELQLRWDF